MSDSVRPHRRPPTRFPRPWDSPGKNIGVGCHFLLQCMKVESERKSLSRVWLLATPWTAAPQAPSSMGFPRQEYWSGVPLSSPQWNVSHKKEWNKAICHKKSGTKDYHTKSDKEGPTSYDITYMWNLRKWYKWSYLQNTNRLTDLENELWSVGAEGRNRAGGRIVRKFVIALCTLPHLKWITSKDPLYSKGNSAQYYITT